MLDNFVTSTAATSPGATATGADTPQSAALVSPELPVQSAEHQDPELPVQSAGPQDLETANLSTPVELWQNYLDVQLHALYQADQILTDRSQGTANLVDVERVETLVGLTSLPQPECDLPAELAQPAQLVQDFMTAVHARLAESQRLIGEQLDQLRPGALTRDRGPVFLDISG